MFDKRNIKEVFLNQGLDVLPVDEGEPRLQEALNNLRDVVVLSIASRSVCDERWRHSDWEFAEDEACFLWDEAFHNKGISYLGVNWEDRRIFRHVEKVVEAIKTQMDEDVIEMQSGAKVLLR